MAADWFFSLNPHLRSALIGAACGFVGGLLLKRLVRSLLVTVGFCLALYLIIDYTTDWLKGVDVAAASRHAVAYAKAHRGQAWATVRQFAAVHLAGATGFAAGLAGGLVLMGWRPWLRLSPPKDRDS